MKETLKVTIPQKIGFIFISPNMWDDIQVQLFNFFNPPGNKHIPPWEKENHWLKSAFVRNIVTLPETNISLKIDPWKRRFLLETIIFRGYVSFREYNSLEGNLLSHNHSRPCRLSSSGRQFKRFSLWSSRCSNWTQMRPEDAAGPMT